MRVECCDSNLGWNIKILPSSIEARSINDTQRTSGTKSFGPLKYVFEPKLLSLRRDVQSEVTSKDGGKRLFVIF